MRYKIFKIVNQKFKNIWIWLLSEWKLDGVGPVDNRPSTDKLHHFVQKKRKKIVTHDMWHVTSDTWHDTHDTWHVWGANILSKF